MWWIWLELEEASKNIKLALMKWQLCIRNLFNNICFKYGNMPKSILLKDKFKTGRNYLSPFHPSQMQNQFRYVFWWWVCFSINLSNELTYFCWTSIYCLVSKMSFPQPFKQMKRHFSIHSNLLLKSFVLFKIHFSFWNI